MARAIFHWGNDDSTLDLNLRFQAFLKKGILEGGQISVDANSLNIQITPFVAASNDGMIIQEENPVSLALLPNQTNVVALKAKYILADDPILEYGIIESSSFSNFLDKDDYIVFGHITLPSGATGVTTEQVDYIPSSVTDKQTRSAFRGHLEDVSVPLSIDESVSSSDDASVYDSSQTNKIFDNTNENSIEYNSDGGFVEYDNSNGPVDLSNVSVGHQFRDGNGDFFTVIRVETTTRRVYIISSGSLPLRHNRPGDFYISTAGTGDLAALYAWNGDFWLNITNTVALQDELTSHRNNLFDDEYHLTEDQELAALGSQGSPSFFNRYVTEQDSRFPTQDENDAMTGLPSNPSGTNKFITEDYEVVELAQFSAALPPFTLSLQGLGPYYIGTGLVGSANELFALMHFEENRGYINGSGIAPKITGLYKESSLTTPINPSIDADSSGFYDDDIYFEVQGIIDIGLRILYGKKLTLTSYDRGTDTRVSPADNYVPADAVMHIQNIKGRPYEDLLPVRESNSSLRLSLDGLITYLGSTQNTSIVAAEEDYEFLQNDTDFGPNYQFFNSDLVGFSYSIVGGSGRVTYSSDVELSNVETGDRFLDGSGKPYSIITVNAFTSPKYVEILDTRTATTPATITTTVTLPQHGSIFKANSPIFEENDGIEKEFTYENTLLSSITYNGGTVTYLDTNADLSNVNVGNTFRDSLGNEYRVTSVDVGLRTVDIVRFDTNKSPAGIITSVGVPDDASIYISNNPRGVLLNELKIQGSEIIPIEDLLLMENEFSQPEGLISYAVPAEKRIEPRLRLFGDWERFQDPDSGEIFIRNFSSRGKIEFTGFFTDLFLLCEVNIGSPELNISFNLEGVSNTVPTNLGGSAHPINNTPGQKLQKVKLANGLDKTKPHHITVSFATTGTEPLVISGIESHWIDTPNTLNWEPGIGFESTKLFRKDTISTVNLLGFGSDSRGGSTVFGGTESASLLTSANFLLNDIDSGIVGNAGGTFVQFTQNVSKIGNFHINDFIAVGNEVHRIQNVILPDTLELVNSVSSSGSFPIRHLFSSGDQAPNTREERELTRYKIISDFSNNSDLDFSGSNVPGRSRRLVAHNDGKTVLAAWDSSIETADRALKVSDTGRLFAKVCATRLDFIFDNPSSFTATISINGGPAFSISVPSGRVRRTLFSNARYSTYDISIQSSVDFVVSDMVIFGPQIGNIMPSAPLAQVDFLSRYQTIAGKSYGKSFYDASKYISFGEVAGVASSWESEEVNTEPGIVYTTNKVGDYFEFWYLGESFELEYMARPDGSDFEVYIDSQFIGTVPTNGSEERVVSRVDSSYGLHHVKIENVGAISGNKLSVFGYYELNTFDTLSATYTPQNGDRSGKYTYLRDTRDYTTFVKNLMSESAFPIQLQDAVDSAYGYTDNTGSSFNLSTSTVGGKTRIQLGFTYITGTNPNTPFGELEVSINGDEIPRFMSGVTQDGYFKEISGNEIELDADYSAYTFSIFIKRVAGPTELDTSIVGTISRQIGFEAVVGNALDLTAGVATHTNIQSAIDDVSVGGKIKILKGTFADPVSINKRVYIEGSGYDTHVDSSVVISSEFCYIKEFRFGDDLTLNSSSKGNIIAYCWQDVGGALNDSGTLNSISLVVVS